MQEYPTNMPQIEKSVQENWQIWHDTGEKCPAETIPMRRELNPVSHQKQHVHVPKEYEVANRATSGHKVIEGILLFFVFLFRQYFENHIKTNITHAFFHFDYINVIKIYF